MLPNESFVKDKNNTHSAAMDMPNKKSSP